MNTMNLCKTISIFLQINKISDDTYINNNYINVITSVKMTSKSKMGKDKNHKKITEKRKFYKIVVLQTSIAKVLQRSFAKE